ncbi:hypothetical protein [Sphingobacterium sp.]|uniref:hypothetical protein n=1 Tax=Sphingobacterium sp. TaxID=341027 RepID=UPI0028AF2598|nr:hypothetical protein [Sphingobacterium sp.]
MEPWQVTKIPEYARELSTDLPRATRRNCSVELTVKCNAKEMTKEHISQLMEQGYHIIEFGVPRKVEGDLWEYLSGLDGELLEIFILEELLTWDDVQLEKIYLRFT